MTVRAVLRITPATLARALGLPDGYEIEQARSVWETNDVELRIRCPDGNPDDLKWAREPQPLYDLASRRLRTPEGSVLFDRHGAAVRNDWRVAQCPRVTEEVPADEIRCRLVPRLPSVLDEVSETRPAHRVRG